METINPREIKEAVAENRVVPAPSFHAGKHGISFADVLLALERCRQVERDQRTGKNGQPLHPEGWIARSRAPFHRTMRIEFNATWDRDVRIFVVTAYFE